MNTAIIGEEKTHSQVDSFGDPEVSDENRVSEVPPESLLLGPPPKNKKPGPGDKRRVSVGGYSRTYSEKRYQINRTRQQEKHSNRTYKTETRITFHRTNPGLIVGPTGSRKITVVNETFSFPTGNNATSEFRNITYFDGLDEDRGEDNIHPLTHITNALFGIRSGTQGMNVKATGHERREKVT
jgi:hypothetical protein